ncbi:MAG: SMP-30/gluconolactonase/LRE family protein [Pirellulaceae bacterium]|nr:SMP-30/gluconolactonase/LRE family protein [Pirellulaceae bacterium]
MLQSRPCIFSFSFMLLIATANHSMLAQSNSLGQIDVYDPAMEQLIDREAKIEILADGFTWTEGPVWIGSATDGHLLFSDIPRNTIFQWKQGEGVSLFMNPSGYTGVTYYGHEPGSNGLLLDADGNLVMCEHGDRRVSVLTPKGGKRTLADNYQGKRLNSPNDAVLKSNGDLYFTDPPYGLPMRENDPRRELDHFGVYRISRKSGDVTLITKQLQRPNGIAFSPDEKTLYVAQSDPKQAIWMAFDIQADGSVGEGRVLHDVTSLVGKEPGLPDGMSVDQKGNLWASGPGGIFVISPQGKPLGRITTGQRTSNCCFGEDGTTLFLTVDMYLCRVKTKSKGL